MKTPLLFACLATIILTACGPQGPKFKNPVVVNADNSPIHSGELTDGAPMALADKGDTLELAGMLPKTEAGLVECNIKPDARLTRFKNGAKSGYIDRKFLDIPADVLKKAVAGELSALPSTPAAPVEHLNKR